MSQNPTGTLGKYQIIREIARSNDIVYEAYDPVMNRRVALKELANPGGSTPQQKEERLRRFHREARAAGSLVHRGIVTVYEVGEDNGRDYIAMEYLDGLNLREEIDKQGFLPPARAVEIATEVLDALSFAHERGVIHRDIKPENIQLLESGAVKITDFGIARLTFEPNLTMDGQVFGTPSYMSPEQVHGRDIDARTDVFSLGGVLYEMIAGQKPFAGDSVVAITYSIVNTEPPQPRQCNIALWMVIRRALEKSPQLRFQSAKDMKLALEEAAQTMGAGVQVIDPVQALHGVNAYPTAAPPGTYPPAQPGQGTSVYGAPVHAPYGTFPQQVPQPGQPWQQPTPWNPAPGGQMPPGPYQGQNPVGAGYPPQQKIPIYHPPAPRKPLMKPETKAMLGRIAAYVLIGLVCVVLVRVAVDSIIDAMERMSYQQMLDSRPARRSTVANPAQPKVAPPPGAAHPKDQDKAVQAHDLGVAALSSRSYGDAVRQFDEATRLDPKQPLYPRQAGLALVAQAEAEDRVTVQLQLAAEAATRFQKSVETETTPVGQSAARQMAAESLLRLGVQTANRGEFGAAREVLYMARGYAEPGSSLEAQIEDTLARLSPGG